MSRFPRTNTPPHNSNFGGNPDVDMKTATPFKNKHHNEHGSSFNKGSFSSMNHNFAHNQTQNFNPHNPFEQPKDQVGNPFSRGDPLNLCPPGGKNPWPQHTRGNSYDPNPLQISSSNTFKLKEPEIVRMADTRPPRSFTLKEEKKNPFAGPPKGKTHTSNPFSKNIGDKENVQTNSQQMASASKNMVKAAPRKVLRPVPLPVNIESSHLTEQQFEQLQQPEAKPTKEALVEQVRDYF